MPIKPKKTRRKRNFNLPDYAATYFKTGDMNYEKNWYCFAFFNRDGEQETVWRDLMASGANPNDFPFGKRLFEEGK